MLWENDAVVDADLRAYGTDTAWYVRVGSVTEDGSFAEFVDATVKSGITSASVKNKLGV